MTKRATTGGRERVAPPEDVSGPSVVVVRSPEPGRRFSWEIRRLSAIVLARSDEDHPTPEAAWEAGSAELRSMAEAWAGRGPAADPAAARVGSRRRGRPRNA